MARHKINLLTHEFPPRRGGAGVYCEEMAYAAASLGYEVKVWAPGKPDPESNTSLPYSLSSLPLRGSQDWRCSVGLIREVRRKVAELADSIVHLAEPGSLRAFVRLNSFTGLLPKRLIITLHGSEIPLFSRFPLEKFFFRKLLRKADEIHLLSHFNKKALLSRFPELASKVVLAPGAARRLFLPENKESKTEKTEDKLRILTVGRLHPRKGQDRILEAIRQMPKELKAGLEYYVIGPEVRPHYARGLREQADSSGVPVHFLGDLPDHDVRIAYESSDLFALTSVPHPRSVEGFGFVYLEAAAHGLPALAHRTGGVEDAVVHNETCLLADPNDPDDLARALERLLRDDELRLRLGQKARERAAGFTWKQTAQTLYGEA
ncbi:glycosyltransferase family 4 protein [Opitutales bacterium]|jgi:phosphatidyl-myo-inositol dimannoside synthase|nr:glycosyltransferase family 4 protein [Opitutales bacterium]